MGFRLPGFEAPHRPSQVIASVIREYCRVRIPVGNSSDLNLRLCSSMPSSFDRYRGALKGTWKDKPLPGAGQTYDLGTHLIDQALALFGKPEKLTGFIQNIRGVGSPEVDDAVSAIHASTGITLICTRSSPFTCNTQLGLLLLILLP